MTEETGIVLLLFGIAAQLTGLFLSRHAVSRYGSEAVPKGMLWHPRDWFRGAIRSRHYFTNARGHRISWTGRVLILLGSTILTYVFIFGP